MRKLQLVRTLDRDRLVDRSDPRPPNPVVRELIAVGAIDPRQVRLPALERCRCAHVPEAHEEILLPVHPTGRGCCRAKRCRCAGYELNPAFEYERGSVNVRKLRVGDEGQLTPA